MKTKLGIWNKSARNFRETVDGISFFLPIQRRYGFFVCKFCANLASVVVKRFILVDSLRPLWDFNRREKAFGKIAMKLNTRLNSPMNSARHGPSIEWKDFARPGPTQTRICKQFSTPNRPKRAWLSSKAARPMQGSSLDTPQVVRIRAHVNCFVYLAV